MAESGLTPLHGNQPPTGNIRKYNEADLGASNPDVADDSQSQKLIPILTEQETDLLLEYHQRLIESEHSSQGSTNFTLPVRIGSVSPQINSAFECLRLLQEFRTVKNLVEQPPVSKSGNVPASTIPFPQSFGRFELRRELGRGGFGIVFLAFDPRLNREVALKIPKVSSLFDTHLRERFFLEGQAAARLEHPNLIGVLEAGEVGGTCYLAMAYYPGPTLSQWLKKTSEPIPPRQAAHFVWELASGVDYAQRSGVLHRDLKPSNILLKDTGRTPNLNNLASLDHYSPMIMDFGLARIQDSDQELTRTGVALGTVHYMAPEQARGDVRGIGTHTDVFALGVILYELLVRTRPFPGDSHVEVQQKILTKDSVSPAHFRKDLPRDLVSICLKCLEKEPTKRYATAGELVADLNRFLEGESVTARQASPVERTLKWMRRHPTESALLAVSVVALLVLSGAGIWHYRVLDKHTQDLETALKEAREAKKLADAHAAENLRGTYCAQICLAADLWQENRIGYMHQLLDKIHATPGSAAVKEFTWRYLKRQAQSERWFQTEGQSFIHATTSRDGKSVVLLERERSLRGWDASTGRSWVFEVEKEKAMRSETISGNGKWVAANVGSEERGDQVNVWNFQTGKVVAKLKRDRLFVFPLLFGPDDQTVIVALCDKREMESREGTVLFWDFQTGTTKQFCKEIYLPKAIAFAPDGRTMIVAGELKPNSGKTNVLEFEVTTGKKLRELPTQERFVHSIAYSPDGSRFALVIEVGIVKVFDRKTLQLIDSFEIFTDWNTRLAYLDRDAIGHPRKPNDHITYWKIRDLKTKQTRDCQLPQHLNLQGVGYTPGSTVYTAWCLDQILRLWSVEPIPRTITLTGHAKEVWDVQFSPDSQTLASASDDHKIRLWKMSNPQSSIVLGEHKSLVTSLAWSPDGAKIATSSFDKTVKLWDVKSKKLLATLTGPTNKVRDVAFSPDGSILAAGGDDRTIYLWDVLSQQARGILQSHQSSIHRLGFNSTTGNLISGGNDYQLLAWDLKKHQPQYKIREARFINALALSPDGKQIACGLTDGVVKIWEADLSRSRGVLGGHVGPVHSVAFSPDGRTLASGGVDKTVRLWHVATGQELLRFANLGDIVHAVAFSPDGNYLAIGLFNGNIELLDAREINAP